MANESDLLTKIEANTRATAQLLALGLDRSMREALLAPFEGEQRFTVYRLSDGARSAREVARLANTTHPTVGRWWEGWVAAGLAEEVGESVRATLDPSLILLLRKVGA